MSTRDPEHCNVCGHVFEKGDPVYRVPCLRCHAKAGSYCKRPSEHQGPAVGFHGERDLLAAIMGWYEHPCTGKNGTRTVEDKITLWVKRLNALGRELDENAFAIHPSAWSEMLRPDIERWIKLAQNGPESHCAAFCETQNAETVSLPISAQETPQRPAGGRSEASRVSPAPAKSSLQLSLF